MLSGADLDVPGGRVVALVGPSGCGKTTLVRLVAGFEAPDAGTIELAGRLVALGRGRPGLCPCPPSIAGSGSCRRRVRCSATSTWPATWGSGWTRRGRTPEGRARVGHMLDLVGLADLAHRRPDQLSGGQQQRVAVARALAPSPDLVCLDEPFSALDATLRTSVRDAVMGALRAEQASVLLVTHDQDEALSVADVVAVMLDGRIAQVGTPDAGVRRAGLRRRRRVPRRCRAAAGGRRGRSAQTASSVGSAWPDLRRGATTLLLRPEQLVCDRPACRESAARRRGARAHVVSVSFHGHDALVSLRTDRGTDLQARVWSGWLPQPGERVRVAVRGDAWPLPE